MTAKLGQTVLLTPQPAHSNQNNAKEYIAFVGQIAASGNPNLLVFPPMGGFYWEDDCPEYTGTGEKTRTWVAAP